MSSNSPANVWYGYCSNSQEKVRNDIIIHTVHHNTSYFKGQKSSYRYIFLWGWGWGWGGVNVTVAYGQCCNTIGLFHPLGVFWTDLYFFWKNLFIGGASIDDTAM